MNNAQLLLIFFAFCFYRGCCREAGYRRRTVRSCDGLQKALETEIIETIYVVRSFVCDTSTWKRSVVINRDVSIKGRRDGSYVPQIDWSTSSKNVIAGRGTTIKFKDLIFVQQTMGIVNIDISFFHAGQDARVIFDSIVVGVQSCPWKLNVSQFQKLERPDTYEGTQSSRQIDDETVEASDVILHWSTRNAIWHLRRCYFTCNIYKNDPKLIEYQTLAAESSYVITLRSRPEESKERDTWKTLVYVVTSGIGMVIFFSVIWCLIARRRSLFDKLFDAKENDGNASESDAYKISPTPETWAILDSNVVIEEPLGHGHFGKVYRGSWQGTTVAVKVIKHNDRCLKTNVGAPLEAFFARRISHPNVVQTYHISKKDMRSVESPTKFFGSPSNRRKNGTGSDSSSSEDMFEEFHEADCGPAIDGVFETWLILEYCDKGCLSDVVTSGTFRAPEDKNHYRMSFVARTALEVASAMNYLHSVRIIHGDLKTGNVLLKGDGSDPRGFVCKVGDFGLSRFLAEDSHIETFTCGTVTHMPPELLKGGVLTSAADVFSFAILLWELLSGKKPYQGKNEGEIVLAVVNRGSRPPFPPNVPKEFMELIMCCWSQDYMCRPCFPEIIDKLSSLLVAYEKEEGISNAGKCGLDVEGSITRSSFFRPEDSTEHYGTSNRKKEIRYVAQKVNSARQAGSSRTNGLVDSNRSMHLSLDGRTKIEANGFTLPSSRSIDSCIEKST